MKNNRANILKASKPKLLPIHVKAWGVDVYARKLTMGALRELSLSTKMGDDNTPIDEFFGQLYEWYVKLLSLALVDVDGVPLFTVEQIKGWDASIYKEIVAPVAEFNGMKLTVKEAEDDLKKKKSRTTTTKSRSR